MSKKRFLVNKRTKSCIFTFYVKNVEETVSKGAAEAGRGMTAKGRPKGMEAGVGMAAKGRAKRAEAAFVFPEDKPRQENLYQGGGEKRLFLIF